MEGENVIKLKAPLQSVNTLVSGEEREERRSRKDLAVAGRLKVSNLLNLFLEAATLSFQVIQPFTQQVPFSDPSPRVICLALW